MVGPRDARRRCRVMATIMHNIMRQTRHKDSRVAMTYIRHGSLFTDNAADGIEPEKK